MHKATEQDIFKNIESQVNAVFDSIKLPQRQRLTQIRPKLVSASGKTRLATNKYQNFFQRHMPMKTDTFVCITDMNEWKKKYKVEKGTKVFICDPKYPDIRESLLARGWFENKD